MAVDIKDVEQVAQELQQKFDDFKAKNDKRVDAIEQEKGKLAGQVETLNGKLSELENLKSDLEKELLELKRPAGGAQNKLATEHKEAFVGFLRKGREDGLRDLERKALQVGTDEDGGYAVPEELDRNILNLLKDEVVMRQEATVITVGGSDYKKLVNLGGTASGWVGETDTRSQTATSRLELIEPLMGEIYGNPQATQKMLDDAFFNVEAWINSELATEFAEQEEIAFTSGDGTKKPKGFLAYESTDETDKVRAFGKLQHIVSGEATGVTADAIKRTGVLKAIFGDDAETLQVVNALIDKGKDGYDQIQQKMNKQASLNKRVQAQLGTLSNLWEAMTGTATNGLAAIGGAFSGDAKNITQWLGELGEKFTKFADENPRVIRGVVGLAAGLAILKLGLMGVGSAISIVSRIMSMTPIGMIATAIALAAGLIITNWDVVGPYFKKLWETIGPYFEAGWELLKKVFAWSPLGMVINNWGPVVKWFQDMWDKLKPIIEWFTDSSGDTVDAINSAQWGAGAYDAYGTGIPARGYTPYPAVDLAQSNNASDATGPNPFMINKASAPKVDGEIKVSFINMPPGMRVTETRSSGIDINHDVGYTRFW